MELYKGNLTTWLIAARLECRGKINTAGGFVGAFRVASKERSIAISEQEKDQLALCMHLSPIPPGLGQSRPPSHSFRTLPAHTNLPLPLSLSPRRPLDDKHGTCRARPHPRPGLAPNDEIKGIRRWCLSWKQTRGQVSVLPCLPPIRWRHCRFRTTYQPRLLVGGREGDAVDGWLCPFTPPPSHEAEVRRGGVETIRWCLALLVTSAACHDDGFPGFLPLPMVGIGLARCYL